MTDRKPWPKGELVRTGGPEMPIAHRVARYRANVLAIRETGHTVHSAMADTLDAAEIGAWLRKSDETMDRLARSMRRVGEAPDGTTYPSSPH